MFSYRQIFKQAFRISWKNKFLWVFGLFASLLSIGAEYQILSRPTSSEAAVNWFGGLYSFFGSGVFSSNIFGNIASLFRNNTGSAIIFLVISLIFLALIIFLIWLAITSQVALIKNSERVINDPKEKMVASSRLHLRSASGHFWPVLGYNLIAKIFINLAVTLVSLPLLFPLVNRFTTNVVYLVLFVALIPTAVCFSLLVKYAIAFLVLKNQDFGTALKNGWKLFKANWVLSIEAALLLFAISFLATFAVLLASLILMLPFVILASAGLYLISVGVFWAIMVVGFLALTVFIILCGSLLTTFQVVAWTDIFMKLNSGLGKSKVERLAPDSLKTPLG